MHGWVAILSFVTTVAWAALVMLGTNRLGGLQRWHKVFFISAMATTGIVGISGVFLLQPWLVMVFPYLGFMAVAAHGFAGSFAKRALLAGRRGRASSAALCQVLLLVGIDYLMWTKPF
ncbi:MAG: hypothetical protein WCD42_01150 [Rhizomicrobium sp.]